MTGKKKTPRKPEYRLAVQDADGEKFGYVGAGWVNNDGSISIVLERCVVLDESRLAGRKLTLLKIDNYPTPKPKKGAGFANITDG